MNLQMLKPNLAVGKVKLFWDYLSAELDEINETIEISEPYNVDYIVQCEKRFQLNKVSRVFYDLMYKEIYPSDSEEVQEVKHVLFALRQALKNDLQSRDKILYDNATLQDEKKEKLKFINYAIKQLRKGVCRQEKRLNELLKKEDSDGY